MLIGILLISSVLHFSHSALSLTYYPNTTCNGDDHQILKGTNVTFSVSSPVDSFSWISLSVNDTTLHNVSTSYFETSVAFIDVGLVNVTIWTANMSVRRIWTATFSVVELNDNANITISPPLKSNTVETDKNITFSVNTSCLIYNKDSILWQVSNQTYRSTSFQHRFPRLIGNSTEEALVQLLYPSTNVVLQKYIKLQNAINNFNVVAAFSKGCVNNWIPITLQIDQGSNVTYTFQNKSTKVSTGFVHLIQNGVHTVKFLASNSISNMTFLLELEGITTFDGSISTMLLMPGQELHGSVHDITENIKWYVKQQESTHWNHVGNESNIVFQPTSPGNFQFMAVLGLNENSRCNKTWQLFVYQPSEPILEFIAVPVPTSITTLITVSLNVFNNSKSSQLQWFYKNEVLPDCTKIVPIQPIQKYSCSFNYIDSISYLKVTLISSANSAYNYSEYLKPFTSFKIAPLVIQVRRVTRLNIGTYNGSYWCNTWMNEGTTSCHPVFNFTKNSTGEYKVDATVFNALTAPVSKTFTVNVVDISQFWVTRVDTEGISANHRIITLAGENTYLQIQNMTLSTQYNWSSIGENANFIRSLSPTKTCTLSFNDTVERNAAMRNYTLAVTAYLQNGPSYTKYFIVDVYQILSNITDTLVAHSMLVNAYYDFNITWHGTTATCLIKVFKVLSENTNLPFNITQYDNHCNIEFYTPNKPSDIFLTVDIGNVANTVHRNYTFSVYNKVSDFFVNYPEIVLSDQIYEFNVSTNIPDTDFKWSFSNSDNYVFFIDQGSMIMQQIPWNCDIGHYELSVTATGPIIENVTITKVYPIKVLTKKLDLGISQSMAIRQSLFGDFVLTVSVERYLLDTRFAWYILEPTAESNGTFHKLSSVQNKTNYSITSDKREGLYTFKLRAISEWMYGECYDKNNLIGNCVEQNITFLLCKPTEPVLAGGQNQSLQKAMWFHSLVSITSLCVIQYKWKIACTLPNDKNCGYSPKMYEPKLLPGLSPQLNTPFLELPPRAFEVGLYRITCELKISDYSISNLTVNLKIFQSPLIPLISGGDVQNVGSNDKITLNAEATIDPDVDYQTPSTLYYRWELSNTSCFINQAGSSMVHEWMIENKILTAVNGCLYGNELIDAKVYIKRDPTDLQETEKSYLQKVVVSKGSVPQLRLICYTCNIYRQLQYNFNVKTKLIAEYNNPSYVEEAENMKFSWTVKGMIDNKKISLDTTSTMSPPGSNILVLVPDILDGKQAYLIEVSIDGASSSMVLQPNYIPENGSCSIAPKQGVALETEFRLQCLNWQDENNQDSSFVYWLLVGHSKNIMSRSSMSDMLTLLPPGEQNAGWILPIEVRIQDSLGAYASVTFNDIIVRRNSPFPTDAVVQLFDTKVKSKDLNIATGTATGIAMLMQPLKDDEKSSIYNPLVAGISELNSLSPESSLQIVQAFSVLELQTATRVVQKPSRDSMLTSIKRIFTLSKAYSHAGLTLENITGNSLVFLLSRNLEYGNIGVKSDRVDENYVYIQKLYDLILSTTLNGENPVKFKTLALSSTIQRAKGKEISLEENQEHNNNINNPCLIRYESVLPEIEPFSELFKISECSRINPYGEINSTSSVISLTFKTNETNTVEIKNLSTPITLNIPTNVHLYNRLNINLQLGRFFTKSLQGIQPPQFGGWQSSALYIVVNVQEAGGDGNIFVHLSRGKELTSKDPLTVKYVINDQNKSPVRTIFISGSEYEANDTYHFGLEHDYFTGFVRVELTIYIMTCHFWNVKLQQWDGTGCKPINSSTEQNVVCQCNHLTSFTSGISIVPNQIDFNVLKNLDIENNPVALVTLLVVIAIYLLVVFIAHGKDKEEMRKEHVIPFIGSDQNFFQYEIRIKTGAYPFSGTTAKVGIQLYGTSCVTKGRTLKTETSFQRNAIDIFRIGLDQSIGKVHKIRIWHDNTGENPSWYLERVVIRSLVNGEKYFFFCNQWIGADSGNGKIEQEFYVANKDEMQKFSTIFYDILSRGFNDFHMWLSLFERPKFSKFSKVQRATCLFTLILTWMAVNAMWFQASKTSRYVLNVGWADISLEEILIGFISAAMVFPINILFYLLFKKSRQSKLPAKKLKIWKMPRRVHMEFVDLATVPLLDEEENDKNNSQSKTLERSSFIHRGTKCLDIHKLLQTEEKLQTSEGNQPPFHNASTTTLSSPTSTLKLPHSFDRNLERTDSQFKYFDTWKREHLEWFRKSNIVDSPPLAVHAASCVSLPRTREDDVNKEEARRIQSAGSIRDIIPEEEFKKSDPRIHMTDINERATSAFNDPSHADESGWLPSEYKSIRQGTKKLTAQIRKNESLAKKLKIPNIVELDSSTRWTLPHWCVYLGYLCCFTVSLFSCLVVLTYGQQFGYPLAIKWLTSLVFGFLEDFFIAYPFVLLLFGIVSALFIKPMDLDSLDHIDFVICESKIGESSSVLQSVSPLSEMELERAKEEAIRRQKKRNYINFILQQMFLLFLLLFISTGVFNDNDNISYQRQYQLKTHVMSSLVNSIDSPNVGGNPIQTFKIDENSWSQYWYWLDNIWLEFLYNEPIGSRPSWRLAVAPEIHQKRGKRDKCPTQKYFSRSKTLDCSLGPNPRSLLKEHWDKYTINEEFISNSTSLQLTQDFYEVVGHDKNSSGIYKLEFVKETGNQVKSRMSDIVNSVKQMKWIDRNTRSLIHNCMLYSESINMYAYVNLKLAAKTSGYHYKSLQIRFFSEYGYALNSFNIFIVFCITVMLVLTLRNWIQNMRALLSAREISIFWFIHLTVLVLMCLVLLIVYIQYLVKGQQFDKYMVASRTDNDGALMVKFLTAQQLLKNVAIIVIFLVVVRCVKMFSLFSIYQKCNKRLAKMWYPLIPMAALHIIILTLMSHSYYLLFHSNEANYKTFYDSYMTLAFYWWIPDPTLSRNEPQTITHFGYFLHFIYTLYYIFFVFNWLKILVLVKHRRDNEGNNPDQKSEISIKNLMSYIWKSIKERQTRPHKANKHVHFQSQISMVSEYAQESPQVTESLTTLLPVEEFLPPLPFCLKEVNERLLSALDDIDNIIAIDGWEQEFYRHYERHFSKHSDDKTS